MKPNVIETKIHYAYFVGTTPVVDSDGDQPHYGSLEAAINDRHNWSDGILPDIKRVTEELLEIEEEADSIAPSTEDKELSGHLMCNRQ